MVAVVYIFNYNIIPGERYCVVSTYMYTHVQVFVNRDGCVHMSVCIHACARVHVRVCVCPSATVFSTVLDSNLLRS